MNTAAKIAIYTTSGLAAAIIVNAVVKQLNDGVGIFTTERRMARFVLTSPLARTTPQKEVTQEDVEWWKSLGKDYRRSWYKATWKSTKGRPTPIFTTKDGTKFKTKGGRNA
jgi:hypothetical protein